MKVYIAGSSAEMARVEQAYEMLSEAGYGVTHKWWEVIKQRGHANPVNASVLEKYAWVREDLAGVREADVIWLLWPKTPSVGCYVEVGFGHSLGKDVVISGQGTENSIFSTLGYRVDKDAAAVSRISKLDAIDQQREAQHDFLRQT